MMKSAEENCISFNEFSIEIQLKILSFCSKNELLKVVSLVCKEWYQLAKDPSLWKRLVIHKSCDFKDGTCVFQKATRLKCLLVSKQYCHCKYYLENESKVLIHLLKYQPPLEELHIQFLRNASDMCLSAFVDLFPRMKCFKPFIGYQKSLKSILVGWPMLTMLDLSQNRGISNSDYREVLLHFKNLTNFGFGNDPIKDNLIEALVEGRQDTLRSIKLCLYRSALSQVSYDRLGQCRRLKKITIIRGFGLSDANLLALKSCPLESISMFSTFCVTTGGWNAFLCSNDTRQSLRSLRIRSERNIDDSTVFILCQSHSHLKVLELNSCELITDHGIELIIEMCSELRKLTLQFLPLVTIAPLKKIPRHLKDLQILHFHTYKNIFNMPVTAAECSRERVVEEFGQLAEELKNVMPNLICCDRKFERRIRW